MSKHLTTGQAASICSVTPDTVLKWIRSGHLPARRTPGGHHRIDREDLDRFLEPSELRPAKADSAPICFAEQAGVERSALEPHLRYCWDYNGNGGVREECLACAVYLMRAHRCYEVAKLAPEAVLARIYCEGSCEACDYFKAVHAQRTNVLVITKDPVLTQELQANAGSADFNLEITDCEYNCSAVVNDFKPDFAIVDCLLGRDVSRDISNHLMQDPRIPYVRVVLAGSADSIPNECDEEVFALIGRPFEIREISECINGFEDGSQKHQAASLGTAGEKNPAQR
jgi:excisionase family DNA binding protein